MMGWMEEEEEGQQFVTYFHQNKHARKICHMAVPTVYILQKLTLIKAAQFSNIHHHVSFQDPKFIAISITSPSQVHVTTTLLLLTAAN